MKQNILNQLINNDYKHILVFVCSFAITYYSIPVIVNISKKKKLFDHPNGRTSHKLATCTLGGIAMFASVFISSMLFINMNLFPRFQYVIAGSLIMFFIGIKDDLIDISWKKKIVGELMAAFFLIALGDFRFTNLHGFLGIHEINYLTSFIITLIVMLGVINAMNLIDGIDGLAAGLAALATTCFGFWFYMDGQYDMMVISASLSGSLLAFLGFNVFGTTNKIFMGDTGSLLLGYIMTFFVIVFNESNIEQTAPWHVHNAPIISFAILFIPLFDTLRVMGIRMLKKKSPFEPDRTHIHHRLIDLGFSHMQTTMILLVINAVFILVIFLLQNLNIHILAVIVLLSGLLKSYVPTYIASRWLKRVPKVVFTLHHNSEAVSENKISSKELRIKN